jgi:hypothetical protein
MESIPGLLKSLKIPSRKSQYYDGFIKGILRGVRCTKSLRVLFLHRRPASWTTLVLYSRAVFIFNEPAPTVCDCVQINVLCDPCAGVRPYKCNLCEKSFTQRCSLESHCLKVHGVAHQYDYKQRRSKVSTPVHCKKRLTIFPSPAGICH